jgi:hypothetical protein
MAGPDGCQALRVWWSLQLGEVGALRGEELLDPAGHVDPDDAYRAVGNIGESVRAAPGQRDRDAETARRELAGRALRQILIARAADLLSGPTGLASYLRTGQFGGPAASVSLPLDVGAATETIPANLRRAVIVRDRHCRFPGCHQPPAACHPHHIIPRSEGGPTCLTNLLLWCAFHHLIAVHRWGWGIVLLPDGSVTATSPIDGHTPALPRAAKPGRLAAARGMLPGQRARCGTICVCC